MGIINREKEGLKEQCDKTFAVRLFLESSSPMPLVIYAFSAIWKFLEKLKIFGTERAPPVSITAADVNDTNGQFSAGVIDTGCATRIA